MRRLEKVRTLVAVVALFLFLVPVDSAQGIDAVPELQATYILGSMADATIVSAYPGENLGTTIDMLVGYDTYEETQGEICRALVRFNLGIVPAGATVESATLRLYMGSSYDAEGQYMAVTAHGANATWSESGVTWTNGPTYGPAQDTASIQHSSWGWYEWDMTDLARQWQSGGQPNYGIILRGSESPTNPGWRSFSTRESEGTTYDPQLVIVTGASSSPSPTVSPSCTVAPSRTASPSATYFPSPRPTETGSYPGPGVTPTPTSTATRRENMRKWSLPIILKDYVGALPAPPGCNTVTLYSQADATIVSAYPGENLGNTVDMVVGYDTYEETQGEICRSVVRFDLASLPTGVTIQSAKLRLYLISSFDAEGQSMGTTVYRASSNWTEAGVTWSNQPGYTGSLGTVPIEHGSWGWYEWDMTDLARQWQSGGQPNYGIILRGSESPTNPGWRSFSTRESEGTTYDPQLVVEVCTPTTPTPTPTATAQSGCHVTKLYSSRDATIMNGHSSTNYGTTEDVRAGYDTDPYTLGEETRGLLYFDVSSLPWSADIESAKMHLYMGLSYDAAGESIPITAYRVASGWTETGVTWRNKPSKGGSYGDVNITHSAWGWYEWDVTDLVRAWRNGEHTNHGIMIMSPENPANPGWRGFYTREKDGTAKDPYLEVRYCTPS